MEILFQIKERMIVRRNVIFGARLLYRWWYNEELDRLHYWIDEIDKEQLILTRPYTELLDKRKEIMSNRKGYRFNVKP